jgi:hypothetical protein
MGKATKNVKFEYTESKPRFEPGNQRIQGRNTTDRGILPGRELSDRRDSHEDITVRA